MQQLENQLKIDEGSPFVTFDVESVQKVAVEIISKKISEKGRRRENTEEKKEEERERLKENAKEEKKRGRRGVVWKSIQIFFDDDFWDTL